MELTLSNLKPYPRSGHSYALGAAVAMELFRRRPEAALGLIVSPEGSDNAGAAECARLAASLGLPVLASARAIERLSPKGNCYAIGVFDPAALPHALAEAAPHVVLVEPADAGNMGTIARTMLAFGVVDLAVIGGVDPFDPRAVRASMGAVFHLRVARYAGYDEYARTAASVAPAPNPPRAFYPFMLSGSAPLEEVVPRAPWSMILGNEASGLPEAFSRIGAPVRIPHGSEVDSLNLSVAAAIGLWHFTRPRGQL